MGKFDCLGAVVGLAIVIRPVSYGFLIGTQERYGLFMFEISISYVFD